MFISHKPALREKRPNTEFFSGPYFPVFELNTEIYGVNPAFSCIQFEYRKLWTRKNSLFRHFSCSAMCVFREGRGVKLYFTDLKFDNYAKNVKSEENMYTYFFYKQPVYNKLEAGTP